MRLSLPTSLLLAAILSACASSPQTATRKNLDQSGALKIHPGLLGQPVQPELQAAESPRPAAGLSEAGSDLKADAVGLQTQRSVYFDLDSADIRAEFMAMLQAHARNLASNQDARLRVDGNADERGSVEYNRRLGLKRAEAVKAALVAKGAKEEQIQASTLGESNPKLKGHDEESWSENRRADLVYVKGR